MFWSFPKEDPIAISKLPREVNKGKCPASESGMNDF